MNKYILFGLVILILTTCELHGQSDSRAGFVITTAKDTIFGTIDYRAILNSGKTCLFRNGSVTQEYTPSQLIGYGFFNDKYFSSQIIEGSFVEVLVEGQLSLYKYGYDLYVQKTGNELFKIVSKQIRDTTEVSRQGYTEEVIGYREDLRWKGILSFLTSDCVESYQTIQNMRLNEKNMTKFVIEYNLCKGAPFKDFKSKKKWVRLGIGVDAGASMSVVNFTGKDYQHDYLLDSYKSWDPSFGLSFDISFPRVNERLALEADLCYFKTGFYSFITGHQGLTKAYYETKIDLSSIAVPVMIKYTLPAKKYSLFFNAGLEFDSYLDTSTSLYTELVNGNTVDSYESEAVSFSRSQIGLVGGIGFTRSFGKMDLGTALRYYQSSKVKTNTGYTTDLSRISLSVILTIK